MVDSTYLIQTLVTALDDSTHDLRPFALYRVYATREAGNWVLANALPRVTRDWKRETIGPVTFVYPPDPWVRAGTRRGDSSVGGRSNAFDRLVFVGSSSSAETYRHERAHVVLQPLLGQGNTAWLMMEGPEDRDQSSTPCRNSRCWLCQVRGPVLHDS